MKRRSFICILCNRVCPHHAPHVKQYFHNQLMFNKRNKNKNDNNDDDNDETEKKTLNSWTIPSSGSSKTSRTYHQDVNLIDWHGIWNTSVCIVNLFSKTTFCTFYLNELWASIFYSTFILISFHQTMKILLEQKQISLSLSPSQRNSIQFNSVELS